MDTEQAPNPEPVPREGSGSSTGGKVGTYWGEGKVIRTRDIDEDDGFQTPPFAAAVISLALFAFSNESADEKSVIVTLIGFAIGAAGARGSHVEERTFLWSTLLLPVAIVCGFGSSPTSSIIAGIAAAGLLLRYAYLWKERYVWEPFVSSAVLLAVTAFVIYGPVRSATGPLFIVPLGIGLIGCLSVISSCARTEEGRKLPREY